MKKVLLIAPPFYRLLGSHFNGLHLGIAYIASFLKEQGHFVKVFNADYEASSNFANLREIFENFPTYKSILNDLNHPIWEEIKDKISLFAPDIIGITMFTANFKSAKIVAQISRSLDPGVKIVVGGPHPTLNPLEVMEQEEFDFVIRGEGELTFLELIEERKVEDIKGLLYRKNREIVHNEERPYIADLDILPFPSRNSFLVGNNDDMEVGYIITGRGCPFSCSYCASPVLWRRGTRFRSIPNVLEELEFLKGKFHSHFIHFVDDTFTLNKYRTRALCQEIINRKLGIEWICEARADTLDEETVSLMAEAGCKRIKIGVESGSDRILKMVKKGCTKDDVRRAVKIIKEHRIPLTAYLMAGFPDETNDDLRQTIQFAREIDADYYSLSIYTPYYGTEIFERLQKSGNNLNKEHWEYFFHQSHEMVTNDRLDEEIIDEFLSLNEKNKKRKRL